MHVRVKAVRLRTTYLWMICGSVWQRALFKDTVFPLHPVPRASPRKQADHSSKTDEWSINVKVEWCKKDDCLFIYV